MPLLFRSEEDGLEPGEPLDDEDQGDDDDQENGHTHSDGDGADRDAAVDKLELTPEPSVSPLTPAHRLQISSGYGDNRTMARVETISAAQTQ